MPRTSRELDDLRKASDLLHYEIWMLRSLANGLASDIAWERPIANALLESFVIHFRVLMYFLYPTNAKPDDIIAEDFFDTPERWSEIRPQLSESLRHAKRRADKEVAHLTYARLDVTPETKPWQFVEIADEISKIIDIFLKEVPKNMLGSRWGTN